MADIVTLDRYTPPPTGRPSNGNKLESTNFENTVLFLVSCFQYILVAAVFNIGPPYREPMWTNGTAHIRRFETAEQTQIIGWLMGSIGLLCLFNLVIIEWPPGFVSRVLNLMTVPGSGRGVLLVAVVVNVILSVVFEGYVAGWIGGVLRRGRRRTGKLYKVVEAGMR